MKHSKMSIQTLSLIIMGIASAAIVSLQLTFFIQVSFFSRSDAKEYAERMATQTRDSVQNVCASVSTIALNVSHSRYVQNYITETEPYDRYLLHRYVNDYIFSLTQSARGIAGVCIYDTDGELVYYTDMGSRPTAESLGIADYLAGLENGTAFFLSQERNPHLICCTPILGIQFDQFSRQKLGYTAVLMETEQLSSLLWSDDIHRVYMENKELGVTLPEENGSNSENWTRTLQLSLPIAGTDGWMLSCSIDASQRRESWLTMLYTALSIIVVSALMMAAYSNLIRRRITHPILRLRDELSRLHEKGLHTHLSGEYPGEVQTIADGINVLVDNLYDLTTQIVSQQQKNYEIEIREEQTRLYALQTQINPHFLFNTLQCLAGIAAAHQEKEIVSVSLSMSRILRYAISKDQPSNGNQAITLQDELKIVGEYLKITEVRFAGRFSWEICAEDDVMESPCLKMLLQPLIENAVTHGLEDCYRDGRIEVKCARRDGMIEVDIYDNGAGIPEDKLSQLRKMLHAPIPAELPSLRSGHIGMMNVHHRIQMVFGKQYGLDILYSGPEGTGIRVKLPDHTASH